MTIVCQICRELIHGPIPQVQILGNVRRAYEFAALYPAMAQHIQRHHKELTPLITAMMDQFALSLAANVFTSNDPIEYSEVHNQAKNAAWAALNQEWRIGLAATPVAGGKKILLSP